MVAWTREIILEMENCIWILDVLERESIGLHNELDMGVKGIRVKDEYQVSVTLGQQLILQNKTTGLG